jgi:hypothetical protein
MPTLRRVASSHVICGKATDGSHVICGKATDGSHVICGKATDGTRDQVRILVGRLQAG